MPTQSAEPEKTERVREGATAQDDNISLVAKFTLLSELFEQNKIFFLYFYSRIEVFDGFCFGFQFLLFE
jgi:hypothetical protein